MTLNPRWGKGGGVINLYEKTLKLENIAFFLHSMTYNYFSTFVCDFWVLTIGQEMIAMEMLLRVEFIIMPFLLLCNL